jgi:predicted short-subunit dehydrogenase-like oxidoreductase (DUF2520 family)
VGVPSLRVIGPGRAGGALQLALRSVGWEVLPAVRHGESVADAARGVDLLAVAVPDAAVQEVAASVEPVASTVVAHLAGSLGLDVLAPHERVASVHPLVALPSAEVGAERLRDHAWFAVAGDPLARRVVEALEGHAIEVEDHNRALYHAAACIASNHVVALEGQAARVAAAAGVPFEAYLALVRATLDNLVELGPAAALTGPAARGDEETLERHRSALRAAGFDEAELAAYDAMVALARRLVG